MFTALHLCSAAGPRQRDFHIVKSSLADIALKVKTDLVLQACQHFKALLDEDGLKQLDERLAHYTAAQVMRPPGMLPSQLRFCVRCAGCSVANVFVMHHAV